MNEIKIEEMYWMGEKVTSLSKEKLFEIIIWYMTEYQRLYSPEMIEARALGQVELFKRKVHVS